MNLETGTEAKRKSVQMNRENGIPEKVVPAEFRSLNIPVLGRQNGITVIFFEKFQKLVADGQYFVISAKRMRQWFTLIHQEGRLLFIVIDGENDTGFCAEVCPTDLPAEYILDDRFCVDMFSEESTVN
ncbi:MAG: hypothetical protein GY793_02185 [Proteobacteria bacterium]|nr:hypothetical protein [Pseudomonadota bacterium]